MLDRLPSPEKPWSKCYVILLKPSTPDKVGEVIGRISFPRISPDGQIPEIGYGFHSDHWGRGYASEAVGLFVDMYWAEESTVAGSFTPKALVGANTLDSDSKDTLAAKTDGKQLLGVASHFSGRLLEIFVFREVQSRYLKFLLHLHD